MQNLCFRTECTILGYSSCENGFVPTAFIVLHCTKSDVWECFVAFRNVKDAKLVFRAWMHYFGERSCENCFAANTSILLHCTKNDVWECFGAFQNLSECKYAQLVFRAWMHYVGEPKLRKWFRTKCINSTPLDPRWCLVVFWSISEQFGT
jgi:hypothetical protein